MQAILSKKTLAIGSGKGGVGKSTVSVNLAVALAQTGLSVGLLDADVYGPSIPIMLGLRRLIPRIVEDAAGKEQLLPFTKFGIKSMSIGFFIEEARSALWRGPMLHTALQKMITDVVWGELDVLLIDLPPGTGDVPISLSQLMKIDGALVVCTPQEVAMLDAIKAINAFDQLQIPLLGIIENMAGYTIPGTQEIHHIFGQGKAQELAERVDTQLLGSIPLISEIRRGGDEGYPAAFHQGDNNAGKHFRELAATVLG
jgi:ATP-binding protein involved in chromosome partitioning